jgi:hypothetical protein
VSLRDSPLAPSKSLIHNTPEGGDCLGLLVEEVLEEPGLLSGGGYEYRSSSSPRSVTQSAGSRESTAVNSSGGYRTAGVVQDAQFIGFDANHNVGLPERQVSVTVMLFLQFGDHD